MIKNNIVISLIFVAPYITCSQIPQQTLMCPTHSQFPSSDLVRKWAFHFLAKKGYANPQAVTIINASCGSIHACAVSQKKTIYFNESVYAQQSIGFKRMSIGHEAIHIIEKHNHFEPARHFISRQQERHADIEGARLGKCETCTKEYAQYLLGSADKLNTLSVSEWKELPDNQKKEISTNDKKRETLNRRINELNLPRTLAEFSKLPYAKRQAFLHTSEILSEVYGLSHPCGLERAYYLYNLSESPEIKEHICDEHTYMYHDNLKEDLVQKLLALRKYYYYQSSLLLQQIQWHSLRSYPPPKK